MNDIIIYEVIFLKVKLYTIDLKTNKKNEFVDISNIVYRYFNESEIENGVMHLFVPHTTAGITINENADFDVKKDMLAGLSAAFPNRSEFKHFEGNSDSHIKATVVGNSQTLIIDEGKLILGEWQGVYFCEFDGPRTRKLYIQIIGV